MIKKDFSLIPNISQDIQKNSFNNMQSQKLQKFQLAFRERLESAAQLRKSDQRVLKHFRRLDSLARLLEGNSICAAVYYHQESGCLWIANNKVHKNSHKKSAQIDNMHSAFNLVSNEELSIETIFQELTKIIILNIRQNKRWSIVRLEKENNIDIEEYFRLLLNDLFQAGTATKTLQKIAEETFVFPNFDIKNCLMKLTKIASRLARDFLKIRSFLLNPSNNDPIAQGILAAIRKKRFKIVHLENNNVHAEMRILAHLLVSPVRLNYIAISKLCCDHCHLALETFNIKSRGVHGQHTEWPIPNFIAQTPLYLKNYMGKKAHTFYKNLDAIHQSEALKFLASQNASTIKENARQGRKMDADSSSSDIEFGPQYEGYDEEKIEELKQFPLADAWHFRHIQMCYEIELKRLEEIGLSFYDIINLYKQSKNKFLDLAQERTLFIIEFFFNNQLKSYSCLDLFEKLSGIYDKHRSLFFNIIAETNEDILQQGLDDLRDRYERKIKYEGQYNSSDEEIDYFEAIKEDVLKENGWGYDYNSDDSQNCWVYNSGSDTKDAPLISFDEEPPINLHDAEELINQFRNYTI